MKNSSPFMPLLCAAFLTGIGAASAQDKPVTPRLEIFYGIDLSNPKSKQVGYRIGENAFGPELLTAQLTQAKKRGNELILASKGKVKASDLLEAVKAANIAGFESIRLDGPGAVPTSSRENSDASPVDKKLNTTIIPKLEFNDTPFLDALEHLQKLSVEHDPAADPENKSGVNFILESNADAGADAPPWKDALITLNLTRVPLREALFYLTALARSEFTVTDAGVVIKQK